MDKIKRIDGWSLEAGSTAVLIHNTDFPGTGMHPATLFISKDATPPKVFTEAEVREILRKVNVREYGYNDPDSPVHEIARNTGINMYPDGDPADDEQDNNK